MEWWRGERHRGYTKVQLAWIKLYLGIFHHESKADSLNSNHLEKISNSLNEKDSSEYVQREKDDIRGRRYNGSLPTDLVICTTSPSGDLSTLTSQKP
jgi:hypothetical protein